MIRADADGFCARYTRTACKKGITSTPEIDKQVFRRKLKLFLSQCRDVGGAIILKLKLRHRDQLKKGIQLFIYCTVPLKFLII